MTSTIISALLPIVVTLILGYVAGWHQDFDGKQAAILNRMVMLYALPLNLFAGMMSTPRDAVLAQGPLALAILLSMAGTYAIVLVIARYICGRNLMTSSLQALAIAGPAVPFVGVSVLGHLFGTASAIPISVASMVMNLIQVPATLMLLSAGMGAKNPSAGGGTPTLASHIVHALREPVVWAPFLALVLVLLSVKPVGAIQEFSVSARQGDRRRCPVCLRHCSVLAPCRDLSADRHLGLHSQPRRPRRDVGPSAAHGLCAGYNA